MSTVYDTVTVVQVFWRPDEAADGGIASPQEEHKQALKLTHETSTPGPSIFLC